MPQNDTSIYMLALKHSLVLKIAGLRKAFRRLSVNFDNPLIEIAE